MKSQAVVAWGVGNVKELTFILYRIKKLKNREKDYNPITHVEIKAGQKKV